MLKDQILQAVVMVTKSGNDGNCENGICDICGDKDENDDNAVYTENNNDYNNDNSAKSTVPYFPDAPAHDLHLRCAKRTTA